MADRPDHPYLEGTPILIGDKIHATDLMSSDTIKNTETYEMDGIVIQIGRGFDRPVITMQHLVATDGLPEEFEVGEDTVMYRLRDDICAARKTE